MNENKIKLPAERYGTIKNSEIIITVPTKNEIDVIRVETFIFMTKKAIY